MSCLTLKRSRRFEDEAYDKYSPKPTRKRSKILRKEKRSHPMEWEGSDIYPAKRLCKYGLETKAENLLPLQSPPTEDSSSQKEQKLFTFNQLHAMCSSMINQSEKQLTDYYELKLNEQMTLQYDTFIKFTHDQMQGGELIKISGYLS
ncbi:akirin-1A [Drosophila guanche]|uniref:akirin-1A n=1 Tax=Drosophila guanche TaxID=7266 RepID=UPI0014722C45|nr:akirin-1A [Drosophila guanche]